MTKSFYSPKDDCVSLPLQKRFGREEEYYSTLFHELVHATGHQTRLGRPTLTEKAGFGSDPYCKEELVAEMERPSCADMGETWRGPSTNSAAYIKGWMERLKSDRLLIVQAAAQAQRAADFVLGALPSESQSDAPENETQPEPMKMAA